MKGDISRSTFEREKHYTGVRMQQGRVLLDSEWNEQADVAAYLDRTANIDIIGPSGASRINGGFAIIPVPGDLILSPGRMWVDGILCECDGGEWSEGSLAAADTIELTEWPGDATRYGAGLWLQIDGEQGGNPVTIYGSIQSTTSGTKTVKLNDPIDTLVDSVSRVRPVYSYANQPHDPEPPHTIIAGGARTLDNVVPEFVVYLDVWTHHLTAVEEESMREVALGGPDTTTRTQTVWRVRLDLTTTDCADIVSPQHVSRLAAQTEAVSDPPNPCIVPSQAGYRGLANQLYRVEIHKSGANNAATFKWSKDNGAFVFGIEETPIAGQAAQLRLHSLGRDEHYGLKANNWVELIDELHEMHGLPGVLARVQTTPQQNSRILDLDPATLPPGTDFNVPASSPIDLTRRPRVRLWAGAETKVDTTQPQPLESGIEVVFSGAHFETGEYWLIPARTAINEETGHLEWPRYNDNAVPLPPRGITHTYAALAHVEAGWAIEECRPLFSPLTAPEFFYVGGDGQEAMPDLVTKNRVQLEYPLQVGVANGGPIENAEVEFAIIDGDGILQNNLKTFVTTTNADGIASTTWDIDAAMPHQMCRARLLKGNGFDPVDLPPIEFNASISVASQVAYDPANCEELQARDARTVQKALDAFCDILDDPKLYFVGGDGQETRRVAPYTLPEPIQVGVADGIRPVDGQQVRFTFEDGSFVDAPLTGAGGVPGVTGINWSLDPNGDDSQSVIARLRINNQNVGLPVVFSASFREEGGGACTIIVEPGPGWEAPLFGIAPDTDAEICFKVGVYPLTAPVRLERLGALKFTGAGFGTRIVAMNHETALRFEHCREVTIRDLSARSMISGRNDETRLNGVLSFHGCGQVTLDHLQVECAPDLDRSTACITIQSELLGERVTSNEEGGRHFSTRLDLPPGVGSYAEARQTLRSSLGPSMRLASNAGTVARVTNCELIVGYEQAGVLIIDALAAWVENNVIFVAPNTEPIDFYIQHRRARERYRRLIFRYPWVQRDGGRTPRPAERNVTVRLTIAGQPVSFVFRSLPDSQQAWTMLTQNPPLLRTNREAMMYMREVAYNVLADRGAPAAVFKVWFDSLSNQVPGEAGAGIIVAGQTPGEVQILGNVVVGAAEAIRVAAGPLTQEQGGRVSRAVITRNNVTMFVLDGLRARHGIHAAGCHSLHIRDNRVDCQRPNGQDHRAEGIWVGGTGFGPMIGVEANYLSNCDLFVKPHPSAAWNVWQWFATDNMTEGKNTISSMVRTDPPNASF